MLLAQNPILLKNISRKSSGLNSKLNRKSTGQKLLGSVVGPQDGGEIFLLNSAFFLPNCCLGAAIRLQICRRQAGGLEIRAHMTFDRFV
jgi:hypothetical protein